MCKYIEYPYSLYFLVLTLREVSDNGTQIHILLYYKASATTFSASFLGDTQMLLHILQGIKASIPAQNAV
jgi:hypothetical protein